MQQQQRLQEQLLGNVNCQLVLEHQKGGPINRVLTTVQFSQGSVAIGYDTMLCPICKTRLYGTAPAVWVAVTSNGRQTVPYTFCVCDVHLQALLERFTQIQRELADRDWMLENLGCRVSNTDGVITVRHNGKSLQHNVPPPIFNLLRLHDLWSNAEEHRQKCFFHPGRCR